MKFRDCAFVLVALLAPLAGLAQEIAGRVLVAAGDVAIVRGTERIAARSGTEIRAGDLLQIGEQSNAQLRLTDESIIALRANTTFRFTEYSFQNRKPEEQRSFFELAKGGMRTVTGIIGRLHRRNYGITTPTATVGIRGTHYVLYQTPPAGNKVSGPGVQVASLGAGTELLAQAAAAPPPGALFGSVTDGVISVTNKAGEFTFGADQYFRVDRPDAAPQRLIAPPVELAQAARPAPKPKPAAAEAPAAEKPAAEKPAAPAPGAAPGGESAGTVAQTGMGGGTGDTGISSSVTSTTAPVFLNPTVVLPTEQLTAQGPATILQPTFSGTTFYRLQGPFNIPLACSDPPCSVFTQGEITVGVNFVLQVAGVSVSVRDPVSGDTVNIGTPFTSQGIPVTVSGGQAVFSRTFNLADNPQNTGAFRCSTCGPGETAGYLSSMTFSGTISGSQATLTISGVDSQGESGSATVTLTSATPPNNDVAAIAIPRYSGGANARSAAFWNVQLDASRRLIDFGPNVGQVRANVGSAANGIAGTAPDAGNLVWGAWTGSGAQVTDVDFVTFSPTGAPFIPWITGTASNTLPASLGTVTYWPVGSLINNGLAVLNSGSITADFVNRNMTLNLDATRTSGELNRFVMSGSSGFSSISGRFSAGFSNVQCVSGPCTSGGNPIGGSFGGFFAGQQAEGAGATFTAGFGVGNGVTGVVAFKR